MAPPSGTLAAKVAPTAASAAMVSIKDMLQVPKLVLLSLCDERGGLTHKNEELLGRFFSAAQIWGVTGNN